MEVYRAESNYLNVNCLTWDHSNENKHGITFAMAHGPQCTQFENNLPLSTLGSMVWSAKGVFDEFKRNQRNKIGERFTSLFSFITGFNRHDMQTGPLPDKYDNDPTFHYRPNQGQEESDQYRNTQRSDTYMNNWITKKLDKNTERHVYTDNDRSVGKRKQYSVKNRSEYNSQVQNDSERSFQLRRDFSQQCVHNYTNLSTKEQNNIKKAVVAIAAQRLTDDDARSLAIIIEQNTQMLPVESIRTQSDLYNFILLGKCVINKRIMEILLFKVKGKIKCIIIKLIY